MFPQIVGLLFGCAYPLHPLNLRYIREKSFEMMSGVRLALCLYHQESQDPGGV
jgi:hypothetical protein